MCCFAIMLLKELNKVRDDIHWTNPNHLNYVNILIFPNTT